MIYSRSAEYAIRSFVYLARIPDGKFAMARQIAEEEKIPADGGVASSACEPENHVRFASRRIPSAIHMRNCFW